MMIRFAENAGSDLTPGWTKTSRLDANKLPKITTYLRERKNSQIEKRARQVLCLLHMKHNKDSRTADCVARGRLIQPKELLPGKFPGEHLKCLTRKATGRSSFRKLLSHSTTSNAGAAEKDETDSIERYKIKDFAKWQNERDTKSMRHNAQH